MTVRNSSKIFCISGSGELLVWGGNKGEREREREREREGERERGWG